MSKRYKIIDERKKRELVDRYNSGTRAKDICRQNNIPLSSFYSWVNKYQKITKRKESKNQITAMDYAELKRSRDRLAMEVEILQSAISNQNLKQIRKFELMEPLYGKYPLRTLCNAMQVRHASFYNHMVNNKNEQGWKYLYREKMKNEIQKLMAEDGHIYGSTMIVDRLAQKGIKTSRRFVSELLSELGVRSANSKSYEYKKRIQELRKANKVATQLLADAPNKVWLTDCTQCYIHDRDVWVCAVIDLYSRKLLAMKVGRNNSTRLTKSTLLEAIKARKPQNLRLHSDQGANYTSYRFNSFLKDNNISHTYSRAGMPKDNAPMESFFKTFKEIEIWSKDFPSYEGLKRRINDFKSFYNSRPHLHLKHLSPNNYEEKWFLENSKNNRVEQ